MLNELYILSQCLQRCGIQVGEPHQDIQSPGKGEGYIVGINKESMPETVEYVNKMTGLWTLRRWNKNSFPFMKLKKSIWDASADFSVIDELKKLNKKPVEKKSKLQSICSNLSLNKQNISLAVWTKDKVDCVRGKDEKINAFIAVTDRILKIDNPQEKFFRKLSELILKNLNDQSVDTAAAILVGNIKGEKVVCDVPLFFDISDWDKYQYRYRVADPVMGKLVGNCLSREISDKKGDQNSALVCDLKISHSGNYPKPKLPIGQLCIFSMNKDALCHKRYGKIASSIFPANKEAVRAMHSALEWSVAEERKGKTWQKIPNIKRKQDLVIAYLEEIPEPPAELVSLISEFDSEDSEMKEADYEERSMVVCEALEGKKGLNRDSKVNILVLTKVDEGRGQVVLSGTYTISNMIESVRQWRVASKNRPDFSVLLPGKKGESAKIIEPLCPSPAEVMRCLQNQWIRSGLNKCKVPGVALQQVYDLFLGDERLSQESARIILSFVLQRLRQLLIGFAAADHARNTKDYSVEARRTVLVGISVLAILLYKLGIKKEDYMGNAAFNVGRLLAFADGLHAQYCKLQMKRKDDLPPQLIGNAVLPVAFENPNKALALLGDRLRIYYAWATKVQGDKYKLVKWMMSEMGKISVELENVTWPLMTDDAVKAQVLLGYLARSKSEE